MKIGIIIYSSYSFCIKIFYCFDVYMSRNNTYYVKLFMVNNN
jgi:hypothetical protein